MSIATLFFLLGLAPHGNFPFTPPPARQTPPAVQTTQATNDSIAQLEKAAMRGDARAQSQLAERYACGDGVPRDEEAALKWWQSAADLGDQEAAQALARYQRDSAPSEQHLPANVLPNPKFTQALRDLTAAAIALQQQAEAGDAHAQYALAERYRKDEAVGANGKHADYWLRRAAAQGEANATYQLGRQYYDSGDYAAARHWLQQAAFADTVGANYLLLALKARQCFKNTRPAHEAISALRNKAKAGDAAAQYRLTLRYLAGKDKDHEQARYWLQQAAENGDRDAQYWLGQHYYHGSGGFPKDTMSAHRWLDKVAAEGEPNAQNQVGMTYFRGDEYAAARYWLQQSAKQGNTEAADILQTINAFIPHNISSTDALLMAAVAGNASAQYAIAWRYRMGIGIEKDPERADYWLQRAAEQGQEDAQIVVGGRYLDDLPQWQKNDAIISPLLEIIGTEGDAVMQYKAGMAYLERGDNVDARRWLHRAAAQGEAVAASALRQLDAQQREVAEQQRRAEMGDSYAQFELSERYRWGKSVAQNQETANYWLQRAAEGDVVVAKYRLGIYYYEGAMGFRKDKAIARTWLDKAAAQSPGTMQFQVGIFYFTHNEYDNARRWLQKVADSNDAAANIAASSLDAIDAIQGVTTTPQKKQKTP